MDKNEETGEEEKEEEHVYGLHKNDAREVECEKIERKKEGGAGADTDWGQAETEAKGSDEKKGNEERREKRDFVSDGAD